MKELLVPVVELLGYLVAAVVFTVAGVFAEVNSLAYLSGDNTIFGIWLAAMGAVALYAGLVALGAQEVLPRLHETLDART